MLSRREVIKDIFDRHDEALYIVSTGYLCRCVFDLFPAKKNIFYMQGSMGLSPSIGLGIALNTQREVVVISGDAALLMHLGIIHSIRDANLKNLFIYILDNGCHESTGGQKCSELEEEYIGVTKIYKINKEGKKARVGITPVENKKRGEKGD